MTYTLRLSREATKTLDKVDRATKERIRARLGELQEDPSRQGKAKPVIGTGDLFSSRVGDWRILYRMDEGEEVVSVVAIRSRGQAYSPRQL